MSNPTSCFNLYNQSVPIPSHVMSPDESACIGIGLDNDELLIVWQSIDCPRVFYEKMYPPTSGVVSFDPEGYQEAQDDMRYVLSKYFTTQSDGHPLVIPGQNGYSQLQDLLINTCNGANGNNTTGVCSKALPELCVYCSREQVSDNTNLLKLCGCFAPDLDPTLYSDVTKECDPLCSQYQVSRFRDDETGIVDQCNSTVCVINNVSITATKSSVGEVNFVQACPNCDPLLPCKCIVDVTVSSSYEQVGLDSVNFYQYCGTNSVCIVIDNQTGKSMEVPCQDNLTEIKATEYNYTVSIQTWILILIIIILTILIIYAYCYTPYDYNIPEGYKLPNNFYSKN